MRKMYLWRDIQTKAGYTDAMVRYRNSLAREINFIFSPRYKKVEEDERAAREYEGIKKGRQRSLDAIDDVITKSKVEIGLILESLTPAADFRAAEMFMRYFGLSAEDVGKDVFYTMKDSASIYNRMKKEKRWIEAFQFLKFFPWSDATDQFEDILSKVFEAKESEIFMMLIREMEKPPFDRMKRDANIRGMIEKECDRVIHERQYDQAKEIVQILEDHNRANLIQAAEELLSRNFEEAFKLLKKSTFASRLQNLILEIHAEEMKKGEGNIEGYRNAFMLARYGGLDTEDTRRYIEQPANKLLEKLVANPNATEIDFDEARQYASHANTRFLSNIIALKCLDLITQNESKEAKKLKEMFDPNFTPGMYDEEKQVREKFSQLTETKGIHDIPKGEENLHMAYDIATIFQFEKDEVAEINNKLCRFYITNKRYDKAVQFFDPKNEDLMELVESEIHRRVRSGDYESPFNMLKVLKIEFSRKSRNNEEKSLKEFVQKHGTNTDVRALAKSIVLEDIYDLNVLPYDYYREVFSFGLGEGKSGATLLVDLKVVMMRRMDAIMKIDLYKMIQFFQQNNDQSGATLLAAYSAVFPPSLFDWIMYYIMKIFSFVFSV